MKLLNAVHRFFLSAIHSFQSFLPVIIFGIQVAYDMQERL